MGLFSRKKKGTPAPPPASSTSSRLPSPPQPIVEVLPVDPPHTLSVLLDGWTEGRNIQCFNLEVSKDADIQALRRALAFKLGDVSMSLFKVGIPMQAAKQARAYTERYKLPVNLITSFPSFNIDDPEQLAPSLGPAGWQLSVDKSDLRIKDWFPEPASPETISLLVRRADGPSTSIPVSFAVHVAQGGDKRRSHRPTTPGGRFARGPTPVLDLAPSTTVGELKSAILRADLRSTEESERLIIWRVEMSEDEMVVIEERGGLKNGQMPWPYPPTAPVPSSLTDSTLPISHYFPSFRSNTRMITLSAYIPASAPSLHHRSLPVEAETAPTFRYPMFFMDDAPPSPASCSTSTATIRSPPLATPHMGHSPVLGASPKHASQRRQRPSTAPALVNSPSGSPHIAAPAFGSRRLNAPGRIRLNNPSPLIVSTTPTPTPSAVPKGLGINTTLDQHRGSMASQLSTLESEDEGSLPSLDLSVLSFDESTSRKGSISALHTPVTERSEWLHKSPTVVHEKLPTTGTTLSVQTPKGIDRAVSVGRASKWGRLVGGKVAA